MVVVVVPTPFGVECHGTYTREQYDRSRPGPTAAFAATFDGKTFVDPVFNRKYINAAPDVSVSEILYIFTIAGPPSPDVEKFGNTDPEITDSLADAIVFVDALA